MGLLSPHRFSECWTRGVQFSRSFSQQFFEMELIAPAEFEEAIRKLRSGDAVTYEEGFDRLQYNLFACIRNIADLLKSEEDLFVRTAFVELIGLADLEEYVPLLVQELSHQDRDVRSYAYSMLVISEHVLARALADDYRRAHPEENFY